MIETEIRHGWIVEDKISGFRGTVETIGDHITGCDLIGVYPINVSSTERGDQEFFIPDQLEIIEKDTELNKNVSKDELSCNIKVGNMATDKVTGFEGVVTAINYKMWECPCACLTTTDGEDESKWVDVPRLTNIHSGFAHEFENINEEDSHQTGAGYESRNLSKSKSIKRDDRRTQ